jgi:hypothetical protein
MYGKGEFELVCERATFAGCDLMNGGIGAGTP